jgi:hypothetical protein
MPVNSSDQHHRDRRRTTYLHVEPADTFVASHAEYILNSVNTSTERALSNGAAVDGIILTATADLPCFRASSLQLNEQGYGAILSSLCRRIDLDPLTNPFHPCQRTPC